MPGGQAELGEDPVAALQREVAEEAGCEITVGRLFGVYSNTSMGLVILAFECSYLGGIVRGGAECLAAGWFNPGAATSAATHSPAAQRIRDGLVSTVGVQFRSYEKRASGTYHETAARGI